VADAAKGTTLEKALGAGGSGGGDRAGTPLATPTEGSGSGSGAPSTERPPSGADLNRAAEARRSSRASVALDG